LEILLPDRMGAHLQYLVTKDEVRAFVTRQGEPYGDVVMNGDVTFSLAASGMEVAGLRADLQSDPGPHWSPGQRWTCSRWATSRSSSAGGQATPCRRGARRAKTSC
jgi:hypothetical protein